MLYASNHMAMLNEKTVIKFCCLILSILFLSVNSNAQKNELSVIAKATPDSIMIRWAPTNAVMWQLTNKYGVFVERYTMQKKGVILDTPIKEQLNTVPLKPAPLESFKNFVEKDPYTAVLAQAIYGEKFELDTENDNPIAQIVNRNREIQNRYSFALFAADISFQAAKLGALGFIDRFIEKDVRYLYKLIPAIPDTILQTEPSGAYVGTKDYIDLPSAPEIKVQFGNKQAEISWNVEFHRSFFTAYQLEISADGKRFIVTDSLPFVPLDVEKTRYNVSKAVSLSDNTQEYYFRLRGRDAFGEYSSPSNIVKGKGFLEKDISIQISNSFINKQNKPVLEWEVPDSVKEEIQFMNILRSHNVNKGFKVISEDLPPKTTEYTDVTARSSNYYILRFTNKRGKEFRSFPVLLQPIDSFPPEIPKEISTEVEAKGTVTLKWKPSPDQDVLGYRVYRRRAEDSELIQLTKAAIADSFYVDSLNLRSLDKHFVYHITAEDKRFNKSEFSKAIWVTKPDTIPPPPPVFLVVKATDKGNFLSWTNSTDLGSDLKSVKLFRKSKAEKQWTMIQEFKLKDKSEFLDESVQYKKPYAYTLMALDSAGNNSTPSKPAILKAFYNKQNQPVTKFTAMKTPEEGTILLKWSTEIKAVKYTLYKKTNEEPASMWKSVSANKNQIIDSDVKIGSSYSYFIKIVFRNGDSSAWKASKTIKL